MELPFGYASARNHQGAVWQGVDPLAGYADFCAQNMLFANAAGDEGFLSSVFPAGFYYNDADATRPINAMFGTHPFRVNPALLKKDIQAMWRNLKGVCNPYLYMMTPNNLMFDSGQYGQPFDKAYNAPATYRRVREYQRQNAAQPDPVQTTDPYRQGYSDEAFTAHEEWSRSARTYYDDGTTDPDDYYHYEWQKTVDRLEKTNADGWMWKNVPVPSTLWGDNVPLARSLLTVWRAEWRHDLTRAVSGSSSRSDTLYYVSKQDYAKGDVRQFTDLDGTDYGNCQQWRFPWTYFNDFFAECKDQQGWISPDDPLLGWGDMTARREQGDYVTYERYALTISPAYFYSVQKAKLTQTVLWPQD